MTTASSPSLVLPHHNDRYHHITIKIFAGGKFITSVTIYDPIVWIMDEDTIDIAQFGSNLSSIIINRSDIDFIYDTGDESWRRKCVIIINPKL